MGSFFVIRAQVPTGVARFIRPAHRRHTCHSTTAPGGLVAATLMSCFSGCEPVRVQFAESQTAYEEKSPILKKIQLFSLIPPGRRAAITRGRAAARAVAARSPRKNEKTNTY